MSRRADDELLADIAEAARRIAEYVSGITYDAFIADTRTQDAVIRNIEIIGEAAKQVSAPLRLQHPSVPWRDMAGVRDRLIHDYSGVNLDIVWQIATTDLPDVMKNIGA
jgi:uncharacterized protein with HEPN domain